MKPVQSLISYFAALPQLAARIQAMSLRQRVALAFAAGFISALAFPPYNLTPLLFLCFPLLLWTAQGARNLWQAALTGWSFAFGFMVLGLYWIAASMFVDIGYFWWAVPLAVLGLPCFFALDYAVTTAIAWRLGLKGLPGCLLFALSWFLGDYLRGHLFTGFPWIIAGYGWSAVLPMLQITSLIGIYGLTLLTLIATCLPALLSEGKKHRPIILIGFLVLAACACWGEHRLAHASHAMVPDVRMRLVQPNIGQAHKWDLATREADFQRMLAMTSAPSAVPVTHVVWPETASTFRLAEDALHREDIAAHLPAAGSVLTGVIRRTPDAQGNEHFYNSMVAVDGRGRLVAGYDKAHLVPFGEYVPLQDKLHIRAIANLGMDFDHGDGARTIRVLGLPSFSPLICYEVIFSGDVVERDDRPHFLLNLTNDGWYGNTAGPYQHFAIARVRAIEEGLPLLRAANTGISGVIDSYGRILHRLGVGKDGYLDTDLPIDLPPTWFSRFGELPVWVLFDLLAAVITVAKLRNKFAK